MLLVNAVFDGLNLVAKEAPLVNERDGVLVLSENAGAHEELGEWALTVNPFDVDGQAEALHEALTMPPEERRRRLEAIRAHVRDHDLAAWIDAAARRPRPGHVYDRRVTDRDSRDDPQHDRALARRRVRRRADGRRRRQAALAGDGPSRGRSVRMAPETARRLRELPKGDALATAQLAGIMAAKRTSDLIPLCHPLPLSLVDVAVEVAGDGVEIVAAAETTAQTGVEMEALVAVSVAALTVYDMAKAIDKGMVIAEVTLVEKTKDAGVRRAVLTVSDGVVAGTREDASGDLLEELLRDDGYEVVRRVVPDETASDRGGDRRARRQDAASC